MRLMTWSFALLALVVWTMIVWLTFSLSDWLAAIAGGLLAGVFSSEIDPWIGWLTASLGNIIQGIVLVLGVLVGLAILAVPAWFNRRRKQEQPSKSKSFLRGGFAKPDGGFRFGSSRAELREEWSKTRVSAARDYDHLKDVASAFIRKHVKEGKFKDRKRGD